MIGSNDAIEVIIHIFHPEKDLLIILKMWEDVLPKQQITV